MSSNYEKYAEVKQQELLKEKKNSTAGTQLPEM